MNKGGVLENTVCRSKNNQGLGHLLLIFRYSWDLSLRSIQEAFSFTCLFTCIKTQMKLLPIKTYILYLDCVVTPGSANALNTSPLPRLFLHSLLRSSSDPVKQLTKRIHNSAQGNSASQLCPGISIDSLRNKVSAGDTNIFLKIQLS